MRKEEITYTDYDGTKRTDAFYFNLTKGEIAELDTEIEGGFEGFKRRFESNPSSKEIVRIFKLLIGKAVGERTVDNKFIKSKEITEAFLASDAYSELFLNTVLSRDQDKLMEFLNSMLVGASTPIQAPAQPSPQQPQMANWIQQNTNPVA